MNHKTIFLSVAILSLLFVSACGDKDPKPDTQAMLNGTWETGSIDDCKIVMTIAPPTLNFGTNCSGVSQSIEYQDYKLNDKTVTAFWETSAFGASVRSDFKMLIVKLTENSLTGTISLTTDGETETTTLDFIKK